MTLEERLASVEQRLAEVEMIARSAKATAGREGVAAGAVSSPVETSLAGNSQRIDVTPTEVYSGGSTSGWEAVSLLGAVPKWASRVYLAAYLGADQGESSVLARQKAGKAEVTIQKISETGSSGIQGLGKGEVLIGPRRTIELNVQQTWAGGSTPDAKVYVEGYE